ncbi:hyaluronan-mediated motility receptor-like [Oncorhynchus kisutch]|uniref:hyaluronan-mediated motility receptor-like n=1 Tax=Oncorhynchus kisutch TaxID=8019 RepID=UPI0012DECA97|nr:hyaluronan-mediated motility receptor-like [Oncorhynchus kisutch]
MEDQVKKYLPSLENHMNEVEKERDDLETAATFEIDKQGLQNQVELMEEKVFLQSQVDVVVQEVSLQSQVDVEVQEVSLQSQVDVEVQEKVTLYWEMEEQRRDFQRMLLETQDKSDTETEHWRRQYEELYAKVKPFQEQLNGFAAERESLLNKNGANQEELTRLADAYARLLGHQNQKQKIRHVVKLKDENISLKQELSKLRAQVSRQKKGGQPQRRVDPSKAFNNQDSKENQQPAATPLRHTSISFSG